MTLREEILSLNEDCRGTKKWAAAVDFDVDEATSKKVLYRLLKHIESWRRAAERSEKERGKLEGINYTYKNIKMLADSLNGAQAAKKHDGVCPQCGKKFSECECCNEEEDFDDDVLSESRVNSIAMRLMFAWGWLPEAIFQLTSNSSFRTAIESLNEKINDCDIIKFRNSGTLTYIIVKIKDEDVDEDGALKSEFYGKLNSECRKVAAAAKKVNKFREHPSQLNSKVEFKGTAIDKTDKKKIKEIIKTMLDIKVS